MDNVFLKLKEKRVLDYFIEEVKKQFPNADLNHLPASIDRITEDSVELEVGGLNIACHYLWYADGSVELWSEPELVETGKSTHPFYEINYIAVCGLYKSDWECGESCRRPCEKAEYDNEMCDEWQDENDMDSSDEFHIHMGAEIWDLLQEIKEEV